MDSDISEILLKSMTVAVVGLSPKQDRPSNQVAKYLLQAGYNVIPVNPGQQNILGRKCYPDLASISEPVDIVDIFRGSEYVPAIVEEAILIKAKAVWMQQGVIHEDAASRARNAGLHVVMDRCIKIDHINM